MINDLNHQNWETILANLSNSILSDDTDLDTQKGLCKGVRHCHHRLVHQQTNGTIRRRQRLRKLQQLNEKVKKPNPAAFYWYYRSLSLHTYEHDGL